MYQNEIVCCLLEPFSQMLVNMDVEKKEKDKLMAFEIRCFRRIL